MASLYKRTTSPGQTSWEVSYDGRLDGKPKGKRSYVHGLGNKKLAEQVRAQKATEEQLLRAGLLKVQPHSAKLRQGAEKSIEALLEEFESGIVARGKKPRYALQQASHVRRLLQIVRVKTANDISASAIQSAARSLIDDEKLSPRTANAAIKAARQFASWLSTSHYTATDLLHRALDVYNEEVDTRRPRRELSSDELERLIDAATTGPRRCGIAGEDRAMLYRVAVGTGFRQAACLSLTPSSFRVAATLTRPSIILAARWNKNGKEREQPIRRDLAAMLRGWLASKDTTAGAKLWPTPPHASLELLVKRDLEAARKKWLDEARDEADRTARAESSFLRYQDHAGRYADFHSLRHTGISLAVRGAGLKAAQVWADHSTPVLTARYAHMDLADEARVLDALPPTHTAPDTARKAQTPAKGCINPQTGTNG